jgi:hypothetical protein
MYSLSTDQHEALTLANRVVQIEYYFQNTDGNREDDV